MNIPLNHKIFPILSEIVTENNLQGYVIGGYVRDLLLKRPSKDIDIVVVGSGIDLAKAVAKKLGKKGKISHLPEFWYGHAPL